MAEKSLDDQLKEAEIAKLKEETALVRKQVNAKWYAGQSLAKFTGFVLTAVALYSVLDAAFLKDIKEHKSRLIKLQAQVAQAALDSLNRRKTRTITTIDSLILDGARFDFLDRPAVLDSARKQYRMIKKEGFYDERLNPDGKGITNKYEKKVEAGDRVIYDDAKKLTWQGGSKFKHGTWKDGKAYVDSLNTSSYAGFTDWRLPTLKEAMSVTIPGSYMDLLFMDTPYIWTAEEYAWTDKGDASDAWVVSFQSGCRISNIGNYQWVRAVRGRQ